MRSEAVLPTGSISEKAGAGMRAQQIEMRRGLYRFDLKVPIPTEGKSRADLKVPIPTEEKGRAFSNTISINAPIRRFGFLRISKTAVIRANPCP